MLATTAPNRKCCRYSTSIPPEKRIVVPSSLPSYSFRRPRVRERLSESENDTGSDEENSLAGPGARTDDGRSIFNLADLDLFVVAFEDDGVSFAGLLRRAGEASYCRRDVGLATQQVGIGTEVVH